MNGDTSSQLAVAMPCVELLGIKLRGINPDAVEGAFTVQTQAVIAA